MRGDAAGVQERLVGRHRLDERAAIGEEAARRRGGEAHGCPHLPRASALRAAGLPTAWGGRLGGRPPRRSWPAAAGQGGRGITACVDSREQP